MKAFARNFIYWHGRGYGLRAAWRMAGRTL